MQNQLAAGVFNAQRGAGGMFAGASEPVGIHRLELSAPIHARNLSMWQVVPVHSTERRVHKTPLHLRIPRAYGFGARLGRLFGSACLLGDQSFCTPVCMVLKRPSALEACVCSAVAW